ncbi:MAG: beta-ketoacyl synthase N-terminal-like domain-containing protein, partial [Myxococcota bacterium]
MDSDLMRIFGVCPFECPDPTLVTAISRAGGLGILDLGRDPAAAAVALAAVRASKVRFGVRVPSGAPPLPPVDGAEVVVLTAGAPLALHAGRQVVEVCSVREAERAVADGAWGLIAKGSEAGGRVGETSAFVLLQQLVRVVTVPIWLQGGIGVHTAAAAIVGGARGVVLDAQLALLAECALPEAVRSAIAAMDGSETRVIDGYRVYDRPDLPIDALAQGLPDTLGVGPLDQRLIPAGQDAALAVGISRRWPRALELVRGLNREIDGHRGQARATRPHAAGSPFARSVGTTYPIFQGPMTRVSDTAAFADAVATGGGMPFLALSLVRGEPLIKLLDETRARLGDRPWGVGMLGFAPQDLRAEQIDAVRRFRPPVALLAGGRPSQARQLEADGIPTWLHVPSPGLLDLFLRDGARRFVLEGRECGGHVGPRTSFVLWEQFVERLVRHDAVSEVSVVFAGGISDARSAAMVSAIAAPLAVRGAKIGLLMGTAYLFTDEAVATGAIGPVFQQAALACTETVLVHTAPGHATRCVDSPFVDAFAETRARMEAAGEPPDAIWEALERLNLGRLRIASKGVVREGDALRTVDADAQRRDGMFMIGQVATLKRETTTIAALHADLCDGADAFLAPPADAPVKAPTATRIAIVGMAGIFPGAPDLSTFWSNVVSGRDAVGPVPEDRWNTELYYDPTPIGATPHDTGKSKSKWGGFLSPVAFDPMAYGIPPRSLAAIDPVQLLALEVARRALDDAGYGPDRAFDRERTSVVFGAEAGTDLSTAYGLRAQLPQYLGAIPPELDAVLPRLTEDSFPGVLGNVIAGRIANRLDLGGINYTVDAACASSLAAVDVACKELAAGTSDVVLAGGADLHNAIGDYLLFGSVHALSPTGRSRPFSADADGIALGEGVGAVVCKRLDDAIRDGDRIYAVIDAIAGSSDGRSLGLTAPRGHGQTLALERAYDRAGADPADIGLVEAHGTGTVVGDRTELVALTDTFTRAGVAPGQITLGSVKSNIGHTKCAAGLAGLIKASLALHHRVLPPSLHVDRPNPAWVADASPFVFRSKAAPWLDPAPGRTPKAAVSAFGFGGTNFHVVLSAHGAPPAATGLPDWTSELVVIRDLADVAHLAAWLDAVEGPPPRLCDLALAMARRGS